MGRFIVWQEKEVNWRWLGKEVLKVSLSIGYKHEKGMALYREKT